MFSVVNQDQKEHLADVIFKLYEKYKYMYIINWQLFGISIWYL